MPATSTANTGSTVILAEFGCGHLVERVTHAGETAFCFVSRADDNAPDQLRTDCLAFIRACHSMGHPLRIVRDGTGDGIGLIVVERPTDHQLKLLRGSLGG